MPYETAEYQNNEDTFHNFYDEIEITGASAGGHFRGAHQTRNREIVDCSELVVCCEDEEFVQTPFAQIPWSHNTAILDKVKTPEQREWYIRKTAENS